MAATALVWGSVCGVASAEPAELGPEDFYVRCTPTDAGLEELSGLVWSDPDVGYAIGDRGSDDRLAVLDGACRVVRWIDIDTETVDVEDLAQDAVGTLWLADSGDNDANRSSIALIGVDPASDRQHRLPMKFADGAHDVEAFALTPTGSPVLVSKVDGGSAVVYTTSGGATVQTMSTEDPTVLVPVGTVAAGSGGNGIRPITGAAVSSDGTIAALRTKKDVFIYAVVDGDVSGAFTSAPAVTIAAPDQPQGEAVAFTGSGDLLLASEANGRAIPPVYEAAVDSDRVDAAEEQAAGLHVPVWMVVLGVAVFGGGATWWAYRGRRSSC